MLTLNQALILVLAILLTCWMSKALADNNPLVKNVVVPNEVLANAGNAAPSTPPQGSCASFLNAHDNNTLEQRPGSRYNLHVFQPNSQVPPAYTIMLLYKPECRKHQLVMLFEYVAKEMLADGTASTANIAFERQLIDPQDPMALYGGYPKIIKVRRTGQVLEYTGYTDYGPLRDWCLNEGLLF